MRLPRRELSRANLAPSLASARGVRSSIVNSLVLCSGACGSRLVWRARKPLPCALRSSPTPARVGHDTTDIQPHLLGSGLCLSLYPLGAVFSLLLFALSACVRSSGHRELPKPRDWLFVCVVGSWWVCLLCIKFRATPPKLTSSRLPVDPLSRLLPSHSRQMERVPPISVNGVPRSQVLGFPPE